MASDRWQTEVLRSKGFCGKIGGKPPHETACILTFPHEGRCGWAVDVERMTEGDLQQLELHWATTLDFNRLVNEVRACWREREAKRVRVAAMQDLLRRFRVELQTIFAMSLRDVKEALERIVEGGGDPAREVDALERARVDLRDLENPPEHVLGHGNLEVDAVFTPRGKR